MAAHVHITSVSRRAVLRAGSAAVACAVLTSAELLEHLGRKPVAFDPVAFVADLRAAGYHVSPIADTYTIYSKEGFGDEYDQIAMKWSAARKADPDHIKHVRSVLLAEMA